jgi:hypothetical protein
MPTPRRLRSFLALTAAAAVLYNLALRLAALRGTRAPEWDTYLAGLLFTTLPYLFLLLAARIGMGPRATSLAIAAGTLVLLVCATVWVSGQGVAIVPAALFLLALFSVGLLVAALVSRARSAARSNGE